MANCNRGHFVGNLYKVDSRKTTASFYFILLNYSTKKKKKLS